jgi:hypothetical protein
MKTLTMQKKTLAAVALAQLVTAGCGTPPTKNIDDDKNDEPEPTKNRALVFVHNPVTDGDPTEITLEAPTTTDGTLTNEYVNALNCLQKSGGTSLFGFANLCVEDSSVKPDADGNYLSVTPPDDFTDGQDPFAEVQMYHHVNVIHDFYKSTFGFENLDFPLDAVVNITLNVQGQWRSFPNAAFIPEESFAAFGLPPRANGAIMFGQGDDVDFSYDASVIYHEYTHAMIGPDRMNAVSVKASGLDNTAGAMNEGLADYFASSVLDDPFLGHYALGELGRDLASARSCPDDLTTEVHADGKIISTALWEIREALGKEIADDIVFHAVQSATQATGLDEFGELVRAEAAAKGADVQAVVEPILIDHGVLGCVRAKPWVDVAFEATAERVPHTVEGTQSAQGGFADGVPGYHQWFVDVPAGKSVELGWTFAPGGGFGAPEPASLHLAVKKDALVEVNALGGIEADAVVDNAPFANAAQNITLTGNCIPQNGGRVFLLFVNPNANADSVSTMSVAIVDAPAAEAVVATCE